MFKPEKMKYASPMKEITIGTGDNAISLGGKQTYPFHHFEGESPNKPKIAMEMWDIDPGATWPEAALAPFKDVVADPIKWAEKCVADGADVLVLHLRGTDPNGANKTAEETAAQVKEVAAAIGEIPLIVWGTASTEKDEEVLKAVAEACQDKSLILGPVEEANHKGIGAAALAYKHMVISSSPIDVNIAKQTNILLENLGLSLDKVLVDPTTGGLGYGMEYSYSVMERVLQAAMMQGDDKLQSPMINFLSYEVWKCKEAGQSVEDAPTLGDPERRGILLETTCAINLLMAGSDLLVMRHPEAVRLVKSYINLMTDGGNAQGIPGISKMLGDVSIDYTAFSPVPDLTVEEKKAPVKKAAAKAPTPPAIKKKEAPAQQAAPQKTPEKAVAQEVVAATSCGSTATREAEASIIAEEKARDAVEAKLKLETEAQLNAQKAEDEKRAKEKAVLLAKEKEEADAIRVKEEAQQAVRVAKEAHEAEEAALRAARKQALAARKQEPAMNMATVQATPAAEQLTSLQKMVQRLDLIHKRNR